VLVFIDDAGDPGFKFSRASSRYFVIACVIFDENTHAEATAERIRQFRAEKGWNKYHELKFYTMRKDVIKEVLAILTTCQFRIRAIVVDKYAVESHELKSKPNSFYNFIIKEVLARDNSLESAKVRIDGRAGKDYRRQAVAYFRRAVNQNSRKIADLKFAESHLNDLIQVADLVAGSIYRSRLEHKTDQLDYINILKPRIDEVWDFG
jgi:hypothetical protein